jgi:hypothetical protein
MSAEPWWGYVNQTLTSEADLLRAVPWVKAVASDPRNYVREYQGESILEKDGYALQSDGAKSNEAEPLLPWVRVRMLPHGARTPIVLTYEVRVVHRDEIPRAMEPRRLQTVRVLSIDLDLLTPTTSPTMPEHVHADEQRYYALAKPLVQLFFPLHEGVGASIMAHDPVPRAMAGGETVHMRTAVLMRFSAPDDDVHATAKRKVQLYGPNGRPL